MYCLKNKINSTSKLYSSHDIIGEKYIINKLVNKIFKKNTKMNILINKYHGYSNLTLIGCKGNTLKGCLRGRAPQELRKFCIFKAIKRHLLEDLIKKRTHFHNCVSMHSNVSKGINI